MDKDLTSQIIEIERDKLLAQLDSIKALINEGKLDNAVRVLNLFHKSFEVFRKQIFD